VCSRNCADLPIAPMKSSRQMPIPALSERTNTAALGDVLYTNYVYFFQIAGLVLLVAMIGEIVLTLRHRTNIKRQNIPRQVARTT
ncbi:NADH-quinone oxidoreductase subunit J, partial [Rhizobium leguminosarum]|uniref:NADH-quinone oxidoreductase subunit J n=1 Tax=Rhizobium leguminosarum TaxID=384 RepID=UPI003F95F971